jgi:hypothetical protein
MSFVYSRSKNNAWHEIHTDAFVTPERSSSVYSSLEMWNLDWRIQAESLIDRLRPLFAQL